MKSIPSRAAGRKGRGRRGRYARRTPGGHRCFPGREGRATLTSSAPSRSPSGVRRFHARYGWFRRREPFESAQRTAGHGSSVRLIAGRAADDGLLLRDSMTIMDDWACPGAELHDRDSSGRRQCPGVRSTGGERPRDPSQYQPRVVPRVDRWKKALTAMSARPKPRNRGIRTSDETWARSTRSSLRTARPSADAASA